jgi:hypothetical protein
MRLTPPNVIEVDATNAEKTKATNVEQAQPFVSNRKFPPQARRGIAHGQRKGPADGSDVRRHIMEHFPDVKVVRARTMRHRYFPYPTYFDIIIASKRQTCEEKHAEYHDIHECVTKKYLHCDARVTIL